MFSTPINKDFVTKSGVVVQGTSTVTTSSFTSTQAGSLQVASGVAIAKNLIVGTSATIYGSAIVYGSLNIKGTVSYADITTDNISVKSLSVSDATVLSGITVINSTVTDLTASIIDIGSGVDSPGLTVSSTGTLMYVSGTKDLLYVNSNKTGAAKGISIHYVDPTSFLNNQMFIGRDNTSGHVTIKNNINPGVYRPTNSDYQTAGSYATMDIGSVIVHDATPSVSPTTGALTVVGGVGVGGPLWVNDTAVVNDIDVLNSANIIGNLTVLGKHTVINSAVTELTASIIDIGSGVDTPGLTVSSTGTLMYISGTQDLLYVNTNRTGAAKGISIHYVDPTSFLNNQMFIGRDTSSGHIIVKNNINPGNTYPTNADYQTLGSYATMDIGSIIVHNTVQSYSTATGAVTVAGGVGIGGSLYAGLMYSNGSQVLTFDNIPKIGVSSINAGSSDISLSTSTGDVIISSLATLQSVSNRGAVTNNAILITNTNSSVSTTTGALVVVGGVGVGGIVSATGINLSNFRPGFGSIYIGYPEPGNKAGTGLDFTYDGGDDSRFYFKHSGTSTGVTRFSTTNSSVLSLYNTGTVVVHSTINSGSTSSGALTISGGVGVGGNLYASQLFSAGSLVITTSSIAGYGVSSISSVSPDLVLSTSSGAVVINNTATLQSVTTRGATTNQAVSISNNSRSVSTTSGALTVAGGLGVGGEVIASGLRVISAYPTKGTINIGVQLTDPVTGAEVAGGTISYDGGNDNAFHFKHYGTSSGSTVFNTADALIMTLNNTGTVQIHSTANSISTMSGALVVSGGVGISGSLYAAQVFSGGLPVLTVANMPASGVTGISTGTADIAVSTTTGFVTISNLSTLQSVSERGASSDRIIVLSNLTPATSTSTGALVVAGGIGANGIVNARGFGTTGLSPTLGNVYIGTSPSANGSGPILSAGNTGGTDFSYSGGSDSLFFFKNYGASTGSTVFSSTITQIMTLFNTGTVRINAVVDSVSTSSGAFTVAGGVGVGGSLYAAQVFSGGLPVLTSANMPVTGVTSISSWNTEIGVSTSTGDVVIVNQSTLQSVTDRGNTTSNIISITNTTSATSTLTGALLVSGGVGVGGTLVANILAVNSASPVIGRIFIGGRDPSGASSTSAPGKIITGGGDFSYDGGTDGNFLFKNYGTGTGTTVFSSTSSRILTLYNTGTVKIESAIDSTSTTTGALIVAGGVGVGGIISTYGLQTVAPNQSVGSIYIGFPEPGNKPGDGIDFTYDGGSDSLFCFKNSGESTGTTIFTSTSTRIMTLYNTGSVSINTPVVSNSTMSGSLIVAGGVGVGGTLNANGFSINSGNPMIGSIALGLIVGGSGTSDMSYDGGDDGKFTFQNYGTSSGSTLFSTTNTVLMTVFNTGTVKIYSTETAYSRDTGALIIRGGVGVGGTIYASNMFSGGAQVITTATLGTPSSPISIINDTMSSMTMFPLFSSAATGVLSAVSTSMGKLQYNPASGTLFASVFQSLSDQSLKSNVVDIVDAVDIVSQLQGVGFDWTESGQPQYGFIAQDVEKVIPEIVGFTGEFKTVNYSGIIPFLVEAVKQQQATINSLNIRITALEEK